MSLSRDASARQHYLGRNKVNAIGKNVSRKIIRKGNTSDRRRSVLNEVKSKFYSLMNSYDTSAQKNNEKLNKLTSDLQKLQNERLQMNEALKKYQEYSKTLENEIQKTTRINIRL